MKRNTGIAGIKRYRIPGKVADTGISVSPVKGNTDTECASAAAQHVLPLLLSPDETAEILRTTRTAVYAMAARGELPGITRFNRRLLVRSADLLDWLNQKRRASSKE